MSAFQTEPASQHFVPQAQRELREAIASNGGMEVFFIGRRGEVTGKIQVVEALCRGNQHSVPALLEAARPGDIVLHNHPSGVLIPSDPDLELASHYGNQAVGFYIIDNAVEQVSVVVKAFAPTPRQRVTDEALEARLGRNGELARTLPGYEWRSSQLQMAHLVQKAFNDDGIAVVEAGTGTGKSMAYLLPAALYALANREVVVVATHTINLQEQLFQKDAPLVQKLPGLQDLKVALMKGRSNYLCNRKLEYSLDSPKELFDLEQESLLESLKAWYRATDSGTRSDLNFPLPEDLWDRLAADEDDCARVRCPNYNECFYFKARRHAAGAHVLIANQHLLMADLAVRHATGDYKKAVVLPPYKRVILDEAHHLEEVATSFTATKVNHRTISRLLGRLLSKSQRRGDTEQRGQLRRLVSRLEKAGLTGSSRWGLVRRVEEEVSPRVETLRRVSWEYLTELALAVRADQQARGRPTAQLRVKDDLLISPLWVELIRDRLLELAALLRGLAGELRELLEAAAELPESFLKAEEQVFLELEASRNKLTEQARRLENFLGGGENTVRWLELERMNGPEPSLAVFTSPIEVAELLHEMLFEPLKTCVLTSATLSVSGRFDYLEKRVGLDRVPRTRLDAASIPSPFDYVQQVYLGVPTDIPDPRDPGFQDAVFRVAEEAVLRSRGGAFILFTSYQLLGAVHQAFLQSGRVPYPLLKHGDEPRHRLLARFKAEANAVLFGTDSFWEGVDVQGEALRMVILTRLPFQVPSEPVMEARCEAIVARGGDPFGEISLPRAVIQFKQGFGRLIRHREDRGVVLVLDPRIMQKRYGRHFLDALGGSQPMAGDSTQILEEMSLFYQGKLLRKARPAPLPSEAAQAAAADPTQSWLARLERHKATKIRR